MYMAYGKPESKPANSSPLLPSLKMEGPTLSDLNPLFHPVELYVPGLVEAFKTVTLGLIDKHGGLKPDVLKAMVVPHEDPKKDPEYRFIARFEVGHLTEPKIRYLEELVKYTYGPNSRTRKNSDGADLPAVKYPPADVPSLDEMINTRLEGWYMGPNTTALNALHQGLLLVRDVGVTSTKNFLKVTQAKRPKFVVEIREANLFQTDLANLVIETATVLGKGKPVDYGQLLYETYYALMRSNLKKEEEGYDLDQILRPIQRGLILPLANPELASAIAQKPESAILCGVSGTGKSLAARELFYQDTGIFIIPIDPLQLSGDIALPSEKRVLLPRIARIRSLSHKPVVLQLDDVEKLFSGDNRTSSTMLNLFAGVQEQEFFVLASTNAPEKIDEALMQPERLGIPVYCGLPSEQARLRILEMHSPLQTPEGVSLFPSPEIRDLILEYVAKNTVSFPPRQLSKIATNAKSVLMERVSRQSGRSQGLSGDDLKGITFSVEDWEEALAKTLETFDKQSTVKRDEEIKTFVIHHERPVLGFNAQAVRNGSFEEVRRQILARQSNV